MQAIALLCNTQNCNKLHQFDEQTGKDAFCWRNTQLHVIFQRCVEFSDIHDPEHYHELAAN